MSGDKYQYVIIRGSLRTYCVGNVGDARVVKFVVEYDIVTRSGRALQGLVADQEEIFVVSVRDLLEECHARSGVVIVIQHLVASLATIQRKNPSVMALHRAYKNDRGMLGIAVDYRDGGLNLRKLELSTHVELVRRQTVAIHQ